jgi:hypothetical protein
MKRPADAKKWLAEFAIMKRVESRWAEELVKRFESLGLQDDVIVGHRVTDSGGLALLQRICDEERVPVSDVIVWMSLNPKTERQQLREAAGLLGWSAEAFRRLGQRVGLRVD